MYIVNIDDQTLYIKKEKEEVIIIQIFMDDIVFGYLC